jgi:hypothetical protein
MSDDIVNIESRKPKREADIDPNEEYWLNEAQTLLLCLLADTKVAADVRHEVVKIVLAWRRGQLAPSADAPVTLGTLRDLEANP